MSTSLTQASAAAAGSTTAVTVANGSNVSVGGTLILVTQAFGPASYSSGSVADTKSGTWSILANVGSPSGTQFTVWQCPNPATGVEHSVTWTAPVTTLYGTLAWLTEWSGGPFTIDGAYYQANAATGFQTTATLNPSYATDVLIASGVDGTGNDDWYVYSPYIGITDGTPNVLAYLIPGVTTSSSAAWASPSDTGETLIFGLTPPILADSNPRGFFFIL